MLHVKIWFVAQLLNFVICLFFFGVAAIIIAPFALLGGLPLIWVFWMIGWIVSEATHSKAYALTTLSIIFPLCTAIAAWLTANYLSIDNGSEEKILIAVPAIATAISVLLHAGRIGKIWGDEAPTTTNAN